MKLLVSSKLLPDRAVLITCSSHEPRCLGFFSQMNHWRPEVAVLFHYDDDNPIRERHHANMEGMLRAAGIATLVLPFTEVSAVRSMRANMLRLRQLLDEHRGLSVVVDISVFTKRHLLLILRWLDDEGLWDRIAVVYSEPDEYDVSKHVPLSFGLSSVHQIPGLPASPDLSRPVHLVLFLGYEGDRALAVYDQVQPMRTTLIIADPPYKPSWLGRTEELNSDLLKLAGTNLVTKVDGLDPDASVRLLHSILGDTRKRGEYAALISPLGTKAQTLGVYAYTRQCAAPPAIVYASPLRHNHEFFSLGIGMTWLLKGAAA